VVELGVVDVILSDKEVLRWRHCGSVVAALMCLVKIRCVRGLGFDRHFFSCFLFFLISFF
jgi:hypothetical protein